MKCVDIISKIFFPPQCLACAARLDSGVLCKSCLADIPCYTTLFCARCGARSPEAKKICHRDTSYLLGSAGPYDNATLKLLIHGLKFHGMRQAAKPLAILIARYLKNIPIDTGKFILIPLPLSCKRQNERGFNQAAEIAEYLAEYIPIQIRNDILIRSRHTKPQTETRSAAERQKNILGCFSVSKQRDIFRKCILLLDDVVTSGATLGEAARTLKAAGARKIIAITAAKA
jgi:ComF family protein